MLRRKCGQSARGGDTAVARQPARSRSSVSSLSRLGWARTRPEGLLPAGQVPGPQCLSLTLTVTLTLSRSARALLGRKAAARPSDAMASSTTSTTTSSSSAAAATAASQLHNWRRKRRPPLPAPLSIRLDRGHQPAAPPPSPLPNPPLLDSRRVPRSSCAVGAVRSPPPQLRACASAARPDRASTAAFGRRSAPATRSG